MTAPDTLLLLARRCEEATEGSRELDVEICAAVFGHSEDDLKQARRYLEFTQHYLSHAELPASFKTTFRTYTSNLDAAVGLCTRVLPEHAWGVHCRMNAFRAHATMQSPIRPMPNIADAASPALALTAAILRAAAAKGSAE